MPLTQGFPRRKCLELCDCPRVHRACSGTGSYGSLRSSVVLFFSFAPPFFFFRPLESLFGDVAAASEAASCSTFCLGKKKIKKTNNNNKTNQADQPKHCPCAPWQQGRGREHPPAAAAGGENGISAHAGKGPALSSPRPASPGMRTTLITSCELGAEAVSVPAVPRAGRAKPGLVVLRGGSASLLPQGIPPLPLIPAAWPQETGGASPPGPGLEQDSLARPTAPLPALPLCPFSSCRRLRPGRGPSLGLGGDGARWGNGTGPATAYVCNGLPEINA